MNQTKVIAVNIPIPIYSKVNQIAQHLKLSPSDLVTQALTTMLDKPHYQTLYSQVNRTPNA
jgi:hypothetical protein